MRPLERAVLAFFVSVCTLTLGPAARAEHPLDPLLRAAWAQDPAIAQALAAAEARGGTVGTASVIYPMVLNELAGTKFKVVTGYPGGNQINLAMESGEVQGRGSNSWSSWKSTRPQWLKENKIHILVQIALKREADLADSCELHAVLADSGPVVTSRNVRGVRAAIPVALRNQK